jgi:predicted nucleic acid-binding protein
VTFNSLQPGLLDACAAVKLVVTEEGSDRLLKTFNPDGSFFIPSFCLFEALGVLKRKWGQEKKRSREKKTMPDHYLQCCFSLFEYVEQKHFNISDPDINSYETFRLAVELTEKHSLDLSETLLLVSLKRGPLSRFAQESKATLVTADGDLETAAKAEGLRVWNCLKQETPPEQIG